MRHRYDPWPGQTFEREDPSEWQGQWEWEGPPSKPDVWNFFPLPPSETNRFMRALFELEIKVRRSNDVRRRRYLCWIDKLKYRDADDRVIPWSLICPVTSGAIGAAFVVGKCPLGGVGYPVKQDDIEKRIQSVSDVDAVGQSLGIIRYLKSAIVTSAEWSFDPMEGLRILHNDVQDASRKLEQWSNSPLGGSSAMSKAHVSIKEWIRRQQRYSRSVYNCR